MFHRFKRSLVCAVALLVLLVGLATAAGWKMLPTEWSIAPPPDLVVATGTLPESARLTADGAHLIVVEAGAAQPAIEILGPGGLGASRHIGSKNLSG